MAAQGVALGNQQSETVNVWEQEMERQQSQVDTLHERLMEVKACIEGSEEVSRKEMEILRKRVKISATLLAYLKMKAKVVADPELAQSSCGVKQLDNIGLVDRNGTPLSDWSRTIDLSTYDGPDTEITIGISRERGSLDELDRAYIGRVVRSVKMVSDVMEALVKRVILAESETEFQKEKIISGKEEIRKKSIQLENMSMKLEEIEKFARDTNDLLGAMQQRVDDLIEETSRQRLRAVENEEELTRVKQDFESLKSYATRLMNVRETLDSSEDKFQTIKRLFDRLVVRTTVLEGEKMQKEAEVQKLMEENLRLNTLLDKKEAQLLALNEQCKVMALNASYR